MSARLLTKSEYARRCGVKPGAVGNWIARGKLTRPAIRRNGRIDAEVADLQLGRTPADMSANAHRRGAEPVLLTGTAAESEDATPSQQLIEVERRLPLLACVLHLDRAGVRALEKWWSGIILPVTPPGR